MWQFAGRQEWETTSRASSVAWLLFYGLFLIYALAQHGSFLLIDFANLVVHEGGHLLFGWFGPTLGIWGGTILQWSVPLLLAAYFYTQRKISGFTFCVFFLFENLLYSATYMCDARAMALPLVTAGNSDYVEHDWHTIFSGLGLLQYDTVIGGGVCVLGWCGMLGAVAWFSWQTRHPQPDLAKHPQITKARWIIQRAFQRMPVHGGQAADRREDHRARRQLLP